MSKLTQELLSTEMAPWRKKALFALILLLSVLPFVILYNTVKPEADFGWWQLRNFIGLALFQALAQIALGWYLLRNKIPNYVMLAVILMAMSFQICFGISVVLLANA
ncbi:hypothetical protein HR45_04615 [Shewanella mangrovi]|uniref:Uncharacterized protein n=1 Tax=Shewanella mangrovi TaxID=1515746 RepID=A0A094JKX7_9GAMM|nr:hypothetical protein [Shewanella mangrovi]KFZ38709.1 hypothetical protein HR45_04615 [Shewanella mangrovi]